MMYVPMYAKPVSTTSTSHVSTKTSITASNLPVQTTYIDKVTSDYRYDRDDKTIYAEKIKYLITEVAQVKPNGDRRIISSERRKAGVEATKLYTLKEVSFERISILRKKYKTGIIVKDDGKYYFSRVSPNFKIVSTGIIGPHLCTNCSHLSAAEDCDGGCQKVRDIGSTKRIEDYSFITFGIEIYGSKLDILIVGDCKNFEEDVEIALPLEEINKRRLALAQNFFPDAKNLGDVKRMRMEQRARDEYLIKKYSEAWKKHETTRNTILDELEF